MTQRRIVNPLFARPIDGRVQDFDAVLTVSANGGAQFLTLEAACNAVVNDNTVIYVYPGQHIVSATINVAYNLHILGVASFNGTRTIPGDIDIRMDADSEIFDVPAGKVYSIDNCFIQQDNANRKGLKTSGTDTGLYLRDCTVICNVEHTGTGGLIGSRINFVSPGGPNPPELSFSDNTEIDNSFIEVNKVNMLGGVHLWREVISNSDLDLNDTSNDVRISFTGGCQIKGVLNDGNSKGLLTVLGILSVQGVIDSNTSVLTNAGVGSVIQRLERDLDLNSNKILAVADGTSGTDGVNKAQMDAAISAIDGRVMDYANVMTVSASGGASYATPQAAVAALANNNTLIIVFPGTYAISAAITGSYDIHMIGMSSFSGNDSLSGDVTLQADSGNYVFNVPASKKLFLNNIKVEGDSGSGYNAINATNSGCSLYLNNSIVAGHVNMGGSVVQGFRSRFTYVGPGEGTMTFTGNPSCLFSRCYMESTAGGMIATKSGSASTVFELCMMETQQFNATGASVTQNIKCYQSTIAKIIDPSSRFSIKVFGTLGMELAISGTPVFLKQLAVMGKLASNLDANSLTVENLAAPSSNGHAVRQTAKITEINLEACQDHRGSAGTDHSDVGLNNTHRTSAGTDHSDVGLANTHRGLTNNPHAVTKTQVSLGNVTDNAQLAMGLSAQISAGTAKAVPINTDTLLIEDSAAANAKKKVTVGSLAGLFTGYVYDLRGQSNGASPNTKVDIATGRCLSADSTTMIINTATKTVDITASGANGLDTGSEASDTWYYIYVIYNPTTDIVAGLLSASPTSPTMPSGYTKRRLVGSCRNDSSSNIADFRQLGTGNRRTVYGEYKHGLLSAGSAASWTDIDCSAWIPATSRFGDFSCVLTKSGGWIAMDIRPKGSSANFVTLGAFTTFKGTFPCGTDDSRFIQYQTTGGDTCYIYLNIYHEDI